MKISMMVVVLTGILISSVVTNAADTRYVSDQLVITLREGMGNKYRVIRTLKTDVGMEVLSAEGRYLYVRLKDGTKGYVLKQYVSRKTPKTVTIARLRDEVDVLKKQLSQQNEDVASTQQEQQTIQQQLAEKSRSLDETVQMLEVTRKQLSDLQLKAEDVVMIDAERQQLKKDYAAAQQELESLRTNNNAILKTAMIKWFIAGAGVLVLGWILGKFSRRKKRGLGSF